MNLASFGHAFGTGVAPSRGIVITLGHMLAFVGVGLVVGAVAKLLSRDPEQGGWAVLLLLAIGGAVVGGFTSRGLGVSGPYEPAGFALSFVFAMLFVGVYLLVRRRLASS